MDLRPKLLAQSACRSTLHARSTRYNLQHFSFKFFELQFAHVSHCTRSRQVHPLLVHVRELLQDAARSQGDPRLWFGANAMTRTSKVEKP